MCEIFVDMPKLKEANNLFFCIHCMGEMGRNW